MVTKRKELEQIIQKNNNLARDNRFIVDFSLPPNIGENQNNRELSMLCEETTWPSSYLQTFMYRDFRSAEEMPHNYSHVSLDMSFIVTNNHFAPVMFKRWQNLILNKSTFRLAYKSEYARDIVISSVDLNNRITRSCKVIDCYPKIVSSMKFSRGQQNNYVRVDVKFSYRDFEELDGSIGQILNPNITA